MSTLFSIDIGLIVSILALAVSFLVFVFSQKKEFEKTITHQAYVDEKLKEILSATTEMKTDIKEIKTTSSQHETKITTIETDLNRLHKNVQELAKEFREFKHEVSKKIGN